MNFAIFIFVVRFCKSLRKRNVLEKRDTENLQNLRGLTSLRKRGPPQGIGSVAQRRNVGGASGSEGAANPSGSPCRSAPELPPTLKVAF